MWLTTTALSKISNAAYTIAVVDTAANVSANIAALNADANISSITLTDGGMPTLALTAAQVVADTTALSKITNNYAIAVTDTAADISADIDTLNANVKISSITLMGTGTPILALSAAQAADDTAALGKIATRLTPSRSQIH